jgi:hypothetical protein
MNPQTIYLLLILAIVVGFVGMILFVLGLGQGRRKIWITGLFSMVAAGFFGLVTLMGMINRYSHRYEARQYSPPPVDEYQYRHDSLALIEYYPDSNYSNILNGYLLNRKEKLVAVRLMISKELENKGVSVLKITQPSGEVERRFYDFISLNLSFSEHFMGLLELKSFDDSEYQLHSTVIEVSQDSGRDIYVDFNLGDHVKLRDIEFLTLSIRDTLQY